VVTHVTDVVYHVTDVVNHVTDEVYHVTDVVNHVIRRGYPRYRRGYPRYRPDKSAAQSFTIRYHAHAKLKITLTPLRDFQIGVAGLIGC